MQPFTDPPAGVLRPSSAERWGPCAGSFRLEGMYPEEEGEEARQGTAAHFYVTEFLQARVWPVGTLTPNGVPIDEEMIECGEVFLDTARDFTWPGVPYYVEHKLTMHATVHPENEGTPDVWSANTELHKIFLADYKYGHGYVDAFRNPQCVNYLAGIFERLGLTREQSKGWEVLVCIVQPRNYHPEGAVRTWRALGWEVWAEIDKLREAAWLAKQPNAPTQTGDWCGHCTGRHACEALRRVGGHVLDLAGSGMPSELTNEALALLLSQYRAAEKRLKALKEGLEAQALAKMRKGEKVPGHQIEHGKGRETWSTPLPEVFALGDTLGVNLRKEAALTPNQARKAGLDPELVKAFATTPTGEAKVGVADMRAVAKAFSR